jgi:hypothetical protein
MGHGQILPVAKSFGGTSVFAYNISPYYMHGSTHGTVAAFRSQICAGPIVKVHSVLERKPSTQFVGDDVEWECE